MIRLFMGFIFSVAGIGHFLTPDKFARIIPAFIPFKKFMVLFTGILELIFGLLLLSGRYRNWHITSMQTFLWSVFPANVHMLTHRSKLGLRSIPKWILVSRLPLQWVMVKLLGNLKRPAVSTDQ